MKLLLRGLLVVALLLAALIVTLGLRYGGGERFPDRSGEPAIPFSEVETVADLELPPGNISVSPDGRVFFTFHPEARPDDKVVELVDGVPVPWPNAAFQNGVSEHRYFRNVLSLRVDRHGRLWTLDNGHHGVAPARLLAFDIETRFVVHEHVFSDDIATLGSHLNDFQVSPDGKTVYIADASFFAKDPAIVVHDVVSNTSRRVIEDHPSVVAEKYTPVVQGREMLAFGLVSVRPGVDSIALDPDGDWLYFAPITNNHLYRVRTLHLRDPDLSPTDIAEKIEQFAIKTMSDGISMDVENNIYLSDLENSAIVRLGADKQLVTLLKDLRIRWPDGLSYGPDGWLYFTCSSLQQVIGKSPSNVAMHAPYQIFRFRPGVPGISGH